MKYGNIDKKITRSNNKYNVGDGMYISEDLNETIYFIERIIYKILTDKGKCISNLLPNVCNINNDISNDDINNDNIAII